MTGIPSHLVLSTARHLPVWVSSSPPRQYMKGGYICTTYDGPNWRDDPLENTQPVRRKLRSARQESGAIQRVMADLTDRDPGDEG